MYSKLETKIFKIFKRIHFCIKKIKRFLFFIVENWPKGRYGLPKPVSGCPSSETTRWKTGFRYHDTEDDGTENQRSDNFHLAANFSEDGISHEFCIKDDFEGEGE